MAAASTDPAPAAEAGRPCLDCGTPLPEEYPGAVCVNCLLGAEEEDADKPSRVAGVVLRVPGHDVLEELARGGMGIVYKAWDRSSARVVALKMLRPQLGGEADMLARFRLEARTLASLQHDAILPVYRVDENDDLPFFTMKFVAGGTLAARRQSFAGHWCSIAKLIATMARAVHYAHSHGVLHRDIKPGNILFDDGGRAYLSDFGLVKTLDGDQSLTATRHFLGTPHYASPEVAGANASAATVASDVWSLGAVLYELLANRPPFEGEGLPTLLRRIVEEPPRPLLPEVPGDLGVICLKCLSKAPEHRYQSAEALAEELQCWLEGRPIKARPAGPAERLQVWVRRNPGIATLSGGLAAALVLLAAALWRQSRTDRALLEESLAREADGRAARRLDEARYRMQTAPWLEAPALIAQVKESLNSRPGREGRELLATLLATPTLVKVHSIDSGFWAARPSANMKECLTLEANGCAIRDVSAGTVLRRVAVLPSRNYPPGPLSPDGRWLVITGNDHTRLYDTFSGEAVLTLPRRCTPIYTHFSTDGTRLVATRRDRKGLVVCDMTATPPSVISLPADLGSVRVCAISADARLLATVTSESAPASFNLSIHDLRTGDLICTPEITDGAPVHMAAFSPDGTQLYAAMINGRLAAWRVADRAPLWTASGHAGGTDSVAVFDHGRALVTQGRDNMTRFWEGATGRETGSAPWRGRTVFATPSGDRIMLELADSGMSSVMAFQPAPACESLLVPLSSSAPYNSYDQGRPSLAFSPDARTLVVTAGYDIYQFGLGAGDRWEVVPGSKIECGRSGQLAPDFAGGYVLHASGNGIRRLPLPASVLSAAFAPEWIIKSPEFLPWFTAGGSPQRVFAWNRKWHALSGPLPGAEWLRVEALAATAQSLWGSATATQLGVPGVEESSSSMKALPANAYTISAALSEDGRLAWVGSRKPDGSRPWELLLFSASPDAAAPGAALMTVPAGEVPQTVAFAADRRSILLLSHKALRCFSFDGNELWKVPCTNREPVSTAGLAMARGTPALIAATLRPDAVTILDPGEGHALLDLRQHSGGAVRAIALSDDGRTLAVLRGLHVNFWKLGVLRNEGALGSPSPNRSPSPRVP